MKRLLMLVLVVLSLVSVSAKPQAKTCDCDPYYPYFVYRATQNIPYYNENFVPAGWIFAGEYTDLEPVEVWHNGYLFRQAIIWNCECAQGAGCTQIIYIRAVRVQYLEFSAAYCSCQ